MATRDEWDTIALEYWTRRAQQDAAHRTASAKRSELRQLRLAVEYVKAKRRGDEFRLSDAAAMRIVMKRLNPRAGEKKLRALIQAGIRRLSRARSELPVDLDVGIVDGDLTLKPRARKSGR